MEKTNSYFVSLSCLSRSLKLPKDYLIELARKAEIPCLDVKGRFRFNLESVRQALDKLPEQGAKNEQ
ncbi:MAG: hypothetical protein H8D56_12745 [Planctomycetes bacterium]|nr:hypothetical protein [Planctomycetota bacterium]MBL7143855.1 hypothetical protein [Phycisphaerae bacterium]